MKKMLALSALISLAACGGGSGMGTSTTPAIPNPQSSPSSNYVTPHFKIAVPAKKSSVKTARSRNFISPSTGSIVIALTSVNGSSSNLPAPASQETDINSTTCGSGCTVAGPASPPGVVDVYSFTLYDAAGGTGNVLGRGTAGFTPVAGQDNSANVTIDGVVSAVIIGMGTSLNADTQGQSESVSVFGYDADGNTITGTYANPITVTDPDTQTTYGTHLTGTHTGTCTGSCVTLTSDSDTATFDYNGLAENPVTVTASASGVFAGNEGTETFTPTLNAIVANAGNTKTQYCPAADPTCASGPYPGIDLFTTAGTGSTGVMKYSEAGYTDSPYSKTLALTNTSGCANIATEATTSSSGLTVFTWTTSASPVAGECQPTVTDGLTNTHPQFYVTYTSAQFVGSSRPRNPVKP